MKRHLVLACDAAVKKIIESGVYEMDVNKSDFLDLCPEYLKGYKEVGRLLSLKDNNTSASGFPLFAWLEDTEPAIDYDSREWRVHFTLDDSELIFTDLDSYEEFVRDLTSDIKVLKSPGRNPWIQVSFWRLSKNNNVWFEYRR